MKFPLPLGLCALSALSVACSSASTKETGTNQAPIDECGLDTIYDGDEYCILPPDPSEGIQIHSGPTDYDDVNAVEPYLLYPGEENVTDFAAPISESGFYYLKQKNRMRPSSHHMLIFAHNDPAMQPGLVPGGCGFTGVVSFIPGSQTPSRDFPGKMATEDEGLAARLNESNMACFQMHYINTGGDGPVLREGWVNLYKEPDSNVKQTLHPIFMVADFLASHPPGQTSFQNEKLALNMTEATRVYGVSAHMHAHAAMYKVWRQAAGQPAPGELIYQTNDWHDPLEAGFNSVIDNPTLDGNTRANGAIDGQFFVNPGDTINWQCEVNNTTNFTLGFGNKAEDAEMCMLVGNYISDTAGIMSGMCYGGNCSAMLGL